MKQKTITTLFKSKEIRDEFILDFKKMCTLSGIPRRKIDKMRPFLLKYCKEGGSIPSVNCIRELHLPKLFACHFAALKAKLANESISIITDEITDCRDHSILNIIASIRGESFLIDVVTLSECNHQTVSQACIRAVTHVDIEFEKIIAFVTDLAAYCKKSSQRSLIKYL